MGGIILNHSWGVRFDEWKGTGEVELSSVWGSCMILAWSFNKIPDTAFWNVCTASSLFKRNIYFISHQKCANIFSFTQKVQQTKSIKMDFHESIWTSSPDGWSWILLQHAMQQTSPVGSSGFAWNILSQKLFLQRNSKLFSLQGSMFGAVLHTLQTNQIVVWVQLWYLSRFFFL